MWTCIIILYSDSRELFWEHLDIELTQILNTHAMDNRASNTLSFAPYCWKDQLLSQQLWKQINLATILQQYPTLEAEKTWEKYENIHLKQIFTNRLGILMFIQGEN